MDNQLATGLLREVKNAYDVNIHALRTAYDIEMIRYIQGTLDNLDDMKARITSEYKKLNKEEIFDDE